MHRWYPYGRLSLGVLITHNFSLPTKICTVSHFSVYRLVYLSMLGLCMCKRETCLIRKKWYGPHRVGWTHEVRRLCGRCIVCMSVKSFHRAEVQTHWSDRLSASVGFPTWWRIQHTACRSGQNALNCRQHYTAFSLSSQRHPVYNDRFWRLLPQAASDLLLVWFSSSRTYTLTPSNAS